MTNLIQADFNGTQVQFQSDAYINATSIAKRFKKQPKDYLKSSRTKEYINALINLHKSNRTKILLEENQLVRIKNGSVVNGGGTWLHPKLAIDFARWLSAEFAVWCDEQIEKILHGNQIEQPKLDQLSTTDSRVPLKDAVNKFVAIKKINYSDAWKIVHQWTGAENAKSMTEAQVEKGLRYIHELTISNALEGELMPRTELPRKDQSNGLALMMHGTKVKNVQDEKISKARHLINEASLLIDQAEKCSGAIWDGLYESRMYMDFSKDERQEAHQKSDDIFECWQSRRKF